MASFTCITCHVAFPHADIQRDHYKTDWHRYNLKRKVAELPPVTVENFQARALAHKSTLQEHNETFLCDTCRKHFSSQNAYQNHLKSKKHQDALKIFHSESPTSEPKEKQNIKNLTASSNGIPSNKTQAKASHGSSSDDSDDEEWEEVEIAGAEDCLFCSEHHSSIEENMKHMTLRHSFFVPDLEFVVDLEGLIGYLAEKIGVHNLCIWCDEKGKAFHTTKSVQQHMLDKGHCKMLYEGNSLVEFTDFYDYSASYPDKEGDPDEEVDIDTLSGDDYELVLPSGAVIGHRSLMRYYKQNIPPTRQLVASKSQKAVQRVLWHYRAIGFSGGTTEMTLKRARDMKYLQKVRSRKELHQGMKNNKLQRNVKLQYFIQ